jgi:hypothetical protein
MVENASSVERDENDWAQLFAAANVELPPDEFTAQVLRRVRRQLLIRRAVLGIALAAGVLFAIGPVFYFFEIARMGLELLAEQWREPAWYGQYALPIAIVLVGIGWPALARWLVR